MKIVNCENKNSEKRVFIIEIVKYFLFTLLKADIRQHKKKYITVNQSYKISQIFLKQFYLKFISLKT